MTKWFLLIFLFLLVGCAPSASHEPPPSYGGNALYMGGYHCRRVIDDQAEIVCYICSAGDNRFMSCVPLSETALR